MSRSRPFSKALLGLFCLLGWVAMAGACGSADPQDGGRQHLEGSAMTGDAPEQAEVQGAISAIREQVQGITLAGTAADQAFARQLIANPPLPPEVVRRPMSEVRERVRSVFGGSAADEAFLFGGDAALGGEGACLLVSYQELLAGGLNVCLDPTTRRVLAIWLTPEG